MISGISVEAIQRAAYRHHFQDYGWESLHAARRMARAKKIWLELSIEGRKMFIAIALQERLALEEHTKMAYRAKQDAATKQLNEDMGRIARGDPIDGEDAERQYQEALKRVRFAIP